VDRVFITGAAGMLGRAVVPLFRERYEVLATDIEECNITDHDAVIRAIAKYKPRFVLHLASMTDVDGCERDPDSAYLINSVGTRNVALACQTVNAVMVYINTGMAYDGTKSKPYTEFDRPDPVNIYANSKYQGEIAIRDLLDRFYIFYTCWLFGGGTEDKKFVPKILELAKMSSEINVADDNLGSPTYTVDVAQRIFEFIESGLYGKYHCVNEGCASRLELAREILRIAGIKKCTLKPVPSSFFSLPAPRPRMEAMRNYHFELLGLPPLRGWRGALEEYIKAELL
jgi:dTDP-4-dehydrorhamnose reductase